MPAHRDLRDPIHGFIRIEGRECDVVDSRVFQRLRQVRQLAMAYLVYPTATHSRFEHTLGVLHVAGRMCRTLEVDEHHRRLIRLAALLHDIGHGPFSHTSESVLSELISEETRSELGATDKIHEMITRRIILEDPELGRLVSDSDRHDIVKLLDDGLDQPLYRSIVSGPIDADKQDYLLRDSYFCGVRYGVFDIDRLDGVLTRERDSSGEILVVEDDGLHTLEQFLLARYFLTTQVIRHKGRLISDAMLVRGLTSGVTVDRIPFLQQLYSFENTRAFCDRYLAWDDERLMTRLLEPDCHGTRAGDMARRLKERRLLKRVFSEQLDRLTPAFGLGAVLDPVRGSLEGEIAELLSEESGKTVAPHEVILDVVKAPPARKSEGSVLLRRTGQPLQPFEERSVIFASIDKTLRAESLECYAPIAVSDELVRRRIEQRVADLVKVRVQALAVPPVAPASPVAGVQDAS